MDSTLITNMLRALLRWWWLIILSVALSVGVAYLLRAKQVNLYAASASIIVGNDPNAPTANATDSQVMDGYALLAVRNNILQPVIDDLQLGVSVGELQQMIDVQADVMTSLVTIHVTDTDPERAARIANSIAEQLIFQTSDRATSLSIDFVTQQIKETQSQIVDLQRQYSDLVDEAETLEFAFDLQKNLDQRDAIDATIQQLRTYLLGLVEFAPQSDLQIFESAVPDYFPIASNSYIDLIFAGAGGGLLAVAMVVLFTFFDDRIQWDEHLHDTILGLKVLGPLGIIPNSKLPLYVNSMPESIETEALRQVRAKIVLAAGGRFPGILTVLSYDSGDGKTVMSSNLAMDLANAGIKTLVIDGDMRRGDMHEIFRMPNIYGLSDILASSDPVAGLLNDAVLDSGYENLAMLPFGRATDDPASLLSGKRFEELTSLLRREFDAVIIDGAPTIAGLDSIFLAEHSDGVVIVVNARQTRQSGLQRSIDGLREGQDVQILGVVFNRVRLQVTTRYSNYYYRQTPGLKPSRFGREMQNPRTGLRSLFANVIRDSHSDERLFSIPASAVRLGVRKRTVRNWIGSGYLVTERHYLRRWVRASTLDKMLEETMGHRTAASNAAAIKEDEPVVEVASVNGANHLSDALRRRDAILGYASQPDSPESKS